MIDITSEAIITINNTALTCAQSLTVRMAIIAFGMEIKSGNFGPEGHLYEGQIRSIQALFGKDSKSGRDTGRDKGVGDEPTD